ncbi:MAG: hypothetical protein DI534_04130 [Leifsonia xyli]|nr:MAG: hypothetical protein DI534_04130 [Leifsonia xyli]
MMVAAREGAPGGVVTASAARLREFAAEALETVGVRPRDAEEMAAQIVASQAAGHDSHGLRRLPEYIRRVTAGHANPTAETSVDLDRGSVLRVDGHHGFGHLVLRDATELLIQRAQLHGIAAVAVRNAEYAGRFADFCIRAADQGIATLLFANNSGAGQLVAPPGGAEGRMSTNPLAAGIPRRPGPHLVLDMATSAVAIGRISEWRDRGEDIPAAWADSAGVMQFFGGVKGFGLALVVEALSGALTEAGTVSERTAPDQQGVLMIGIDISRLRRLDDFHAEVDQFVGYVAEVPVEEGCDPVRIPGQRGFPDAAGHAEVEIQPFTWRALRQTADELGLTPLQASTRGER